VAAQDVVKAAKVVEQAVLPVLKKAASSETTVEAVTGLIDPMAVGIERTAFAALGVIIQSITAAGAAAAGGGVNVSLDAALLADIKAITPTVKAKAATLLASVGAPAPATA
jgi:hypothetical protein